MGGRRKSATALPSRVNSGFTQTAKSFPARLPLAASSVGIASDSAVPGSTVLRSTIQWNPFFARRASPTSRQLRSTLLRSNLPLRKLGVPTQRKEISDWRTAALVSVLACSRQALWLCAISSANPGSSTGGRPDSNISTYAVFTSTPRTRYPLLARQAAVTAPTYPQPKTLLRRLILAFFSPKH